MTDDLGQKGRAASVDDLMKGWNLLVPYFNNVADAYKFIKATNTSQADIDNQQKAKEVYESQSGKKLYFVALLMSQGMSGIQLADSYLKFSGVALDMQVFSQVFPQAAR